MYWFKKIQLSAGSAGFLFTNDVFGVAQAKLRHGQRGQRNEQHQNQQIAEEQLLSHCGTPFPFCWRKWLGVQPIAVRKICEK